MNLNFTLILQIISFFVLLGLLTKILYKPFTEYLDERSSGIKNLMEDAERDRKKAEEYLKNSTEELHKTKEEIMRLRETTRRSADKEKLKTIDQAKREAIAVLEKAGHSIKKEIEKAKNDVKRDIASLSVNIARKILGREIKESDHKKLIEESIEKIENEG